MKRREARTTNSGPQFIASLLDMATSEQARPDAARMLELILHQLELAELTIDCA